MDEKTSEWMESSNDLYLLYDLLFKIACGLAITMMPVVGILVYIWWDSIIPLLKGFGIGLTTIPLWYISLSKPKVFYRWIILISYISAALFIAIKFF